MSKFLENLFKAAKTDANLAAKLKRAEDMGYDLSKVYYHGTPETSFKEFDLNKKHTGSGTTAEGYGIYFAEDPELANNYAGKEGRVIPVFLKNGNYINVDNAPKPTSSDVKKIENIFKSANDYENSIINYGDENPKKAQQIANYYIKNSEDIVNALHEPANSMFQGNLNQWGEALSKEGYSGFQGYLRAGESPIKVVPDVNNIKSVFAEFKDKKGLMSAIAPVAGFGNYLNEKVDQNPVKTLSNLYSDYKQKQEEAVKPAADYMARQLDLSNDPESGIKRAVRFGSTEALDPLNYIEGIPGAIMTLLNLSK